jgi:hypothetical protein
MQNKLIQALFGLFTLCLSVATVSANTVITFDDLPSYSQISNGYAGLNWNNFYVLNTPDYGLNPSGYQNGTVSVPNVAFNAWGNPASISSTNSAGFSLVSGDLPVPGMMV